MDVWLYQPVAATVVQAGVLGAVVSLLTVVAVVGSFLGRPWRLGAVLIRFSIAGLWGAGAGGAEMHSLRMESKCVDRVCLPGSMLIEGLRL